MCEYCEKEEIMMEESAINDAMIQWTDGVKPTP